MPRRESADGRGRVLRLDGEKVERIRDTPQSGVPELAKDLRTQAAQVGGPAGDPDVWGLTQRRARSARNDAGARLLGLATVRF
jgi:hypothetical protein